MASYVYITTMKATSGQSRMVILKLRTRVCMIEACTSRVGRSQCRGLSIAEMLSICAVTCVLS